MTRRRRVAAVAFAAALLLLASGTGAFSSVAAERGVDVNVVPDERAYLGIEAFGGTYSIGEPFRVLELWDNLGTVADLELRYVRGSDPVSVVDEGVIGPSEAKAGEVRAECDGATDGMTGVAFTVLAVSENESVVIDKQKMVQIRCKKADLDSSDIEWNGVGNAEITASGVPYPISVTVVYDEGGSGDCTENGTCQTVSATVDKNEKVRSQGNQLVAIEITDDDFENERFPNPNYPPKTNAGNKTKRTTPTNTPQN